MAEITMDLIKKLREWSGAGIMDCKGALQAADGDLDKAMEVLRKQNAEVAARKAHRETKNGMIGSYLHTRADGGVPSIGVLVEVNCETDFAARSEVFKDFVKKLCLHVAAANPLWLNAEQIPAEVIEKEKEIAREQLRPSGKPDNIIEKIVEGKIKKFVQDSCLLDQEFALGADKSEQVPISQLLKNVIGTLGENMSIRRFVRFDLNS